MKGEGSPLTRAIRMLALTGSVVAVLVVPPATAGAASVSPTELDFGSVPVGTTSPPQTITLTAECTTIIPSIPPTCASVLTDTINVSLGTTGEFAATSTCPAGLGPDLVGAASQSCPITVTFSPAGAGAQVGTLSTGTIGPGGLLAAPAATLTGTGVSPAASTSSPGTRTRARCRKHKKRRHHHSALAAKKKKCHRKRKRR